MAARIVEALGPHSWFIDLMCGSFAVLFEKERSTMETCNDLHGDLINLARQVQGKDWGNLHDYLQRTFVGPEFWKAAAAVILNEPFEPTWQRAAHYFTYCWQGRNGSAGTDCGQAFCMRFTSNGGSPGTRFKSTVDSIPDWVERFRDVVITNYDAFDFLDRLEDKLGTVVYVDPPYIKKSAKYTHDFDELVNFDDGSGIMRRIDKHEMLAIKLRRFKLTRIVVSYYEHPLLADLYPGWQKKSLVQQGQRGKDGATKANEVLLINQHTPGTLFA